MSETLMAESDTNRQAQARAEWISRVLGVDVRRGGVAGLATKVSLVKLGRARIEWRDTLAASRRELSSFKQALAQRFAGVPDPQGLVPAALKQLDESLAQLDDALLVQLDAVLNGSEQERPPLIATAQSTMRAFRSRISADPVMAALDGNEVRPETIVTGPLHAKLAEIEAAFS